MRFLRFLPLALFFAVFLPKTYGLLPTELKRTLVCPSNIPQAGAKHGQSVAADGNLAVVGAPSDDTGANGAGVVHVYDTTTGALLYRLTNPSPQEYGSFGSAVAVQGTRVAVGAPSDAAGNGVNMTSKVYVYDLAGVAPLTPVAVLPNPTPAFGDNFGRSVAIGGTRVVVGAPGDDTASSDAGSVYVFDLASGSPTTPVLTLSGPAGRYGYGTSVAMSGTRIAIGAVVDGFALSGPGPSGKVYVHDLAGATPAVPLVTLSSPQTALSDTFAISVAMSGSRVVVGADRDDTAATDAGRAYVFDVTGSTPTVPVATLAKPGPLANDLFGFAVAVSGARVVVGALGFGSVEFGAGSAYVFDVEGGTPDVPVAILENPSPAAYDEFGFAVAVAGTRAVIGAPYDDLTPAAVDTGTAYLYDLSAGPPAAPTAMLASASLSIGDGFGSVVAVSGNIVVAGAPYENTGAARAGGAYIYDLANATPAVPVLVLHRPNPQEDERFGSKVAVSGNRVVVCDSRGGIAYLYDLASATPAIPVLTFSAVYCQSVALSAARLILGTSDGNGGHVYVYDLSGATPTVPVMTLSNPNPETSDGFGNSVAISGSRVVVGAPFRNYDFGGAYVFDLESATPAVPTHVFSNPLGTSSPSPKHFGSQVSIAGSRVAVGAYGHYDFGAVAFRQGAFVYDLAGSYPPYPVTTNSQGSAVVSSGALVAVGSTSIGGGVAYLYDYTPYNPSGPTATIENPLGNIYSGFGQAVAMDGPTVVMGASAAQDRGVIYIYQTPTPDSGTMPPTLTNPAVDAVVGNSVNVAFSLPEAALGQSVSLRFNGAAFRSFTLTAPFESSGAHSFSFTPGNPLASPAFRPSGIVIGGGSGGALPDGLYSVTLSYQDAPGNPPASASATNVRIDTTAPAGGTMTLTPGPSVGAGAAVTVTFAGWTDAGGSPRYTVLVDDVVASAAGSTASRNFTAPVTPGLHVLKGRVADLAGNVTEVTQTFNVLPVTEQQAWRQTYFGVMANAGSAADMADPDGDGGTNLFEFVAGLTPTDPASRFNVRVEAVVNQPTQRRIIFAPLMPIRTYVVKYRDGLEAVGWITLTDFTVTDNANERTVTDLSPGNSRFYRVEITRP